MIVKTNDGHSQLSVTTEDVLNILQHQYGAKIIETRYNYHIWRLGEWNFINNDIFELLNALGDISMLITENFQFVIKKRNSNE